MQLKHKELEDLLKEKHWDQVTFAKKLGLNYSYIYRILHKQRGIGKKFINQFILLCQEEDLDYTTYIKLSK